MLKHAGNGLPILILANKCDKEEDRVVDRDEIDDLVKQKCLKYFETSTKSNMGIYESMNEIIEMSYAVIK